jgi:hypothetical protein
MNNAGGGGSDFENTMVKK